MCATLADRQIVGFDLETTGADRWSARIVPGLRAALIDPRRGGAVVVIYNPAVDLAVLEWSRQINRGSRSLTPL